MVSWQFLLIGSFAALGAALALGTLAALWRYHRTGAFPNQPEPGPVDRRQLVASWLRVGVGLVVAVVGVAALSATGAAGG